MIFPWLSLQEKHSFVFNIIFYDAPLCKFFDIPVHNFQNRNIFFSTLFSNTLNLCSSIYMRNQVSHPHKTTGITFNKCLYLKYWEHFMEILCFIISSQNCYLFVKSFKHILL
jgi:hypothetical protein